MFGSGGGGEGVRGGGLVINYRQHQRRVALPVPNGEVSTPPWLLVMIPQGSKKYRELRGKRCEDVNTYKLMQMIAFAFHTRTL